MGNPYQHYNTEATGCFQRLWELEGGDGNDVGYNYFGGDHLPDENEFSDDDSEDEGPEGIDGQLNEIEDMPLEPQRLVPEPEQEPIADEEHEGIRADLAVAQDDAPLVFRLAPAPPRPAPAPVLRPGEVQPNPQPAAGRLGGRFARAAARRAAAEAEAAERRLEARNAAWNRRMGRDAPPEHGGPDM